MYIKDKQTIISKNLFKKMQTSLRDKDAKTIETLDVVAMNVINAYTKNPEIQSLSETEKEKLHVYLQMGFSEPL